MASITESGAAERSRNRRGQGAKLRDDLLAAAKAMVTESGGAQVLSLRGVAARAGVAATSVYLHFADLDALKVALAQRCFVEFAAARDASSAGVDDPARALILRSQAYVQYAVDHPGLYRLMFSPDLPPLDPGPAGASGTAPSTAALNGLAAGIGRCLQAGCTADTTDPARLALLVWSALHGQATLRIDRPHGPWPPLEETIPDLMTRLLGLGLGEAGSPADRDHRDP